jgi:hypothetical protein
MTARSTLPAAVGADPIPPERVDGDQEYVRAAKRAWAGEPAIGGTTARRGGDDGPGQYR